jgi:molybdopterin-guanine dinucleotide biosynthesis adapter protein
MNHPWYIGVVGHKKSGKTTLVERLTNEMSARGIHIGTIKITTHDLEFDFHGKDTHRHRMAGSELTLIKSKTQVALYSDLAYFDDDQIQATFRKCDFVFIEGDSGSDSPKIYVSDDQAVRKDISGKIIAVWGKKQVIGDAPNFAENEIGKLCDFLLDKFKTRG